MNDLLTPAGGEPYDASSIDVLDGLEAVRKRPGMYIGGTDERALHHMAAEIIDNSMDEAVAGFANRIEVTLHEDYAVTVTDNGRGIPIDPHPKFPEKSALEVIFTELHAGGKFSGKAYQTSGGLHGVGSTVVNALSDSLVVKVAKNKELFEQRFVRGVPQGKLEKIGAAPNRRGTEVTFHVGRGNLRPPPVQAQTPVHPGAVQGLPVLGRRDSLEKRYRRWRDTHRGDLSTSPAGLSDYLKETLGSATTYADQPFGGKVEFREKFGEAGYVEWSINWTPSRDGFIQSYCNTVPTPEGGTHVTGFWAAILKGIKAYGELVGNKKAGQITRDDLMTGGCALVSCFIADPAFVGQTKDRLSTEAGREDGRRVAVRDHFDNWLAADNKSAGAILDFLVLRAEERLRRKQEKETAAQIRHQEAAPARQAGGLFEHQRARAPSCSSSRATRPAARPRWRATARPRRCCPCAARS